MRRADSPQGESGSWLIVALIVSTMVCATLLAPAPERSAQRAEDGDVPADQEPSGAPDLGRVDQQPTERGAQRAEVGEVAADQQPSGAPDLARVDQEPTERSAQRAEVGEVAADQEPSGAPDLGSEAVEPRGVPPTARVSPGTRS